jgi:hypothetical protein
MVKNIIRCDDATTCVEQEGTEIMAENIQKINFIRKISSQTKEHSTIDGR